MEYRSNLINRGFLAMTHPAIISRRASTIEDLQQTFHHIDSRRLQWLAGLLDECEYHGAARLAREWAREHEMTADRLSGASQVGDAAA
jgi:hypothetical protein